MEEEGAEPMYPSSSSEISLSHSTHQHTQTSRIPTLNVTHNNIERHAKNTKTDPETPYKTRNSPQNTNRKAWLHL